ncbi:hypothetical protein JCM10213_009145 [Rhodosporidiobolus nylandii]
MYAAYRQESPYFAPAGPSSTSANDAHFDPHDPAWFTPSIPSTSTSTHPPAAGSHSAAEGYPLALQDECEVLSYGYEQGEAVWEGTVRRYSEGDGALFSQPEVGATGRQLGSTAGVYSVESSHGFFDSEYTLAPPAPLPSSSSSRHSSRPSTSSYPSLQHASYPCSVEHYPSDAMAATADPHSAYVHTSSKQYTQQDRTLYTPTPLQPAHRYPPHPPPGPASSAHAYPPTTDSTYSVNITATAAYEDYEYEQQQQAQLQGLGRDNRVPFPSTARSPASYAASSGANTPAHPSLFPVFPPASASSSASGQPNSALRPSPFVSSSASTASSGGATRRSRRLSLAHSHTQSGPELTALQAASRQLLASSGMEASPAGPYRPFSGGSSAARDESRRNSQSAMTTPGGFSPYPNPREASFPRRRNSQVSAASTAERGRTSASSSLSHSVVIPSSAPAQQQAPQAPLTPSSRRSSFDVNMAVSPSPYYGTFPRSARRNNRNLTISVDAAVSASSSRAGSHAGSPIAISPYSPCSPIAPGSASRRQSFAGGSAYPCPPSVSSPAAGSRKRRYSADPYLSSLSLGQAQEQDGTAGSSLANFAGAAAGMQQVSLGVMVEEEHPNLRGQQGQVAPLRPFHPERRTGYSRPQFSQPASDGLYQALPSDLQQEQQLRADGNVGLGLEMGVEEMHLAASSAAVASGALAPSAFGEGSFGTFDLTTSTPSSSAASTSLSQPYLSRSPSHPFLHSSHSMAATGSVASTLSEPEDVRRQLEGEIRAYLGSENRMEMGERTVVVMNPRIAQRSYGNEKRLLAPPPLALLLGGSWWSTLDSHPHLSLGPRCGNLPSPSSPLGRATLPPEVFISISTDKEPLKNAATLSWMSDEGKLIHEREEGDAPPLAGRAVSKSLAVSVPGELNKDVSTTVTTVVSIAEPGYGNPTPRVWARIAGKPMSVISKPSKKKSIAAGAAAGLTHGTLVSLYNRTRTYAGSTRYLCSSGIQSMFPLTDWHNSAGGEAERTFAPNGIRDVRFSSETTAWDAFVIYAVDIAASSSKEQPIPLHPSYPRPPPNAVPLDPKKLKPLYYNQTVVLQDLATSVISPVLIIRRCDPKGLAVGGASIEDFVPAPSEAEGYPVAPGEKLGEAVTQYRPIALEIFQDVSKDRTDDPLDSPLPEDSYLGVVDDEVGVHQAREQRTFVQPPGEAASPVTPTSPRSFAAMQRQHLPPLPRTEAVDTGSFVDPDETRPKRPRRTSSVISSTAASPVRRPPATLAHSHRRGQSLTSLATMGGGSTVGIRGKSDSSKAWTIPVGEHCVWSIVNVDAERHTFWIPPSVEGGRPPSLNPPPNHLYTVPRPFVPIGPHLPKVLAVEPSELHGLDSGMLALRGENFDSDLFVWIGDVPCTAPPIICTPELLYFRPPLSSNPCILPKYAEGAPSLADGPRIALVRSDGVVFLTLFTVPVFSTSQMVADGFVCG